MELFPFSCVRTSNRSAGLWLCSRPVPFWIDVSGDCSVCNSHYIYTFFDWALIFLYKYSLSPPIHSQHFLYIFALRTHRVFWVCYIVYWFACGADGTAASARRSNLITVRLLIPGTLKLVQYVSELAAWAVYVSNCSVCNLFFLASLASFTSKFYTVKPFFLTRNSRLYITGMCPVVLLWYIVIGYLLVVSRCQLIQQIDPSTKHPHQSIS